LFSLAQTIFKIVGVLLLISVCPASAHAASDALTAREGEVSAHMLNIRSGPGKSFRVVGKMQKGNRLVILEFQPKWLKISHDNREGFVSREHIRLIPLQTPVDDASPAPFDPSEPLESVGNRKQETGRIEKQIVEHEARVSAYTEKEAKLIDDLDHIGQQLNQTKLQAKESREEGMLIEAQLKNTESEYLTLEKEIALLDVYAAKRLVALFKLHQLGKMPVLASADSIFDLLGRKSALERILSADKAVWEELTTKKNRLEALRSSLDMQKQAYDDTIRRLNEQMDTMGKQSQDRSRLLEKIRGEKNLTIAAIDSLKQAAIALDKEVESYGWEVHPVSMQGDKMHKKSFESLKGLLQTPVPGKIAAFFGLNKEGALKSANFRNGIDIKAEPGEPIRAVHEGNTIYADWFKGYGNMIIIDHGNNYCTIYAHAEELFKAKGDPVDINEVIGTVGETGSMTGTKLYFEIRYHGKPIDPLSWLKRN
jgi:murein hydrolase activator